MHEYSIAAEIVEAAIEKAGTRRIRKIQLHVGELSGIFDESLKLYLDIIFTEKNFEAVEIVIEPVSAVFLCSCGKEYSGGKLFDPCPVCGGFNRKITAGQNCTIESIEVDNE